jgi:hypothetical protein
MSVGEKLITSCRSSCWNFLVWIPSLIPDRSLSWIHSLN